MAEERKATADSVDLDEFSSVGSFLFTYRTPKFLKIQVPLLGIIFRVLQGGLLGYIIWQFIPRDQWAISASAIGTYNSWPEAGTANEISTDTLPYCNNASYDYEYSPNFRMNMPECQTHTHSEVAIKLGKGEGVFFTTACEAALPPPSTSGACGAE